MRYVVVGGRTLNESRSHLYVVDARQQLHFSYLSHYRVAQAHCPSDVQT